MISIQGKGVSAGVAMGPLYYYQRAKSVIRRIKVVDAAAEWSRFKAAQNGRCGRVEPLQGRPEKGH